MHDGFMWGMGWTGILFWIVVILIIAALIKYVVKK